MARPSVLSHGGFQAYASPPFDSILHPGLYRQQLPMPMRAPELPAAYQQQHTGHHHGRASTVSLAGPAYMATDEELAQLQKLSNEYQPEVSGPLVGERQSSSAITTEYAHADPVYRIKTAALPSKYAFFRTCRGDGHCGWRAIAFGYFEALTRVGDANVFDDEKARLQSMHNLLNAAGFAEHVYIDFVDECFELLDKLAAHMRAGNSTAAADTLLDNFNDVGVSMAIITYFKLLASAWMQANPNDFEPFLEFGNLKQYCSTNIEAAQCEIDHLGIAALAEAVVKPAGFALEVLYLDRSPGEEINSYNYEPSHTTGSVLTLRLLYRPGHYDILYKAEDVSQPIQQQQPVPSQAPLHVALAGYTDDFVPMSSNMSDVMTMIPGMYSTGLGQRWPSVSYDYNPNPAPQPQITPAYPPAPTPAAAMPSTHQEYVTPVQSHVSHHNPPSHHSIHLEPPVSLPIHTAPRPPPPMSIERAPPPMTVERGPFRPSMYEWDGFQTGQSHAVHFQTSIFRNSHYNTAHFLNPDFQPEEWSPDSEYATGNKGRHKSTSQ